MTGEEKRRARINATFDAWLAGNGLGHDGPAHRASLFRQYLPAFIYELHVQAAECDADIVSAWAAVQTLLTPTSDLTGIAHPLPDGPGDAAGDAGPISDAD